MLSYLNVTDGQFMQVPPHYAGSYIIFPSLSVLSLGLLISSTRRYFPVFFYFG